MICLMMSAVYQKSVKQYRHWMFVAITSYIVSTQIAQQRVLRIGSSEHMVYIKVYEKLASTTTTAAVVAAQEATPLSPSASSSSSTTFALHDQGDDRLAVANDDTGYQHGVRWRNLHQITNIRNSVTCTQ